MEDSIRRFFARYEQFFLRALAGEPDPAEVAGLYAEEFIAASPAGVKAGKNDASLLEAMRQGHAQYRAIGTRDMRVRGLRLSPIDEMHCVAHVAWRATYLRADLPETVIDFEVHYLMQQRQDGPRVFGWISGDETAVLRQHGVL